jgi:hypothetical protein
MAETTAKKQRGKPFAKGRSGNPIGRPRGARNRATVAVETLLDGEAEALTRVAIEKAKAGDMTAMRLCMERIAPPRKERTVSFDIPKFSNASDAVQISGALIRAVAEGHISPAEAAEVGKLIETYVRTLAASELEDRIQRLEKVVGESRTGGRGGRASDYLQQR